jgi:PAS domain S-box-containing protein
MRLATALTVLLAGIGPARPADPADRPASLSIGAIRRMPFDELRRRHPVRLQATVTFHEPRDSELFVHDGSEGLYVYTPPDTPRLSPGTVVVIEGFTDPGEFAPSVRATQVRSIRPGDLPATRRYGYDELIGGREDCQLVDFEGVVRGAGRSLDVGPYLLIRFGPTTYRAKVGGSDPESLRHLFGATVRVRAVCGSEFNARRQWRGLLFFVPSAAAIQVVRPAPTDLTAIPSRSVESLAHFDPGRGPGEPVKVAGVVISRRGNSLVVQDETGGVTVVTQPGHAADVGQSVEVLGFPVRRGRGWALEDGTLRPTTAPVQASAVRDISAAEVVERGVSNALVRLDAILVDQFPAGAGDQVFLLRSIEPFQGTYLFFPALLPRDRLTPELLGLRPDTRVRITGVASLPTEPLMVSAFRVLLRDAEDVQVVARPSWWTPGKALTVAGVVAAVAVVALAWVVTLRKRVAWQTEEMRGRLEREAHLEARYRDLFESASDAVFTLDPAGTVTAMNLAGAKLTGLAVGDSLLSSVSSGSAADAKELLACQAPITKEISLLGPGGTVHLEVSARPVVAGGSGTGVQAIARDLTQRRRLEAELRQAQKMEAIGRLAGGVAHDFNNLLTVINGNAHVLRGRLAEPDDGLAEEIVRAGERAAALTRQLLAFSRKQVLAPKVLCPNASVEALRKMLARLVGERVEIVTDLDETVGCVKIDPGQLEQALMNLAVNARDAMPQGGKLTIRTRSRPEHVRIEVIDTGVGMDATIRSRIFEPFFTTKAAGEGTGLGLATVKTIVEQAGGKIGLYSEPGRGATFMIDLPLCREQPAVGSPVAPTPPPSNREVILLVEDEAAVRVLERRVLEMGKYDVLVAATGEEALTVMDQHPGPIDLLVTDVVMPGMTGRELAEAAGRRRPGLRALFLSGYTPDEVLRQGVRAEEAHFLQKPFTPSALLGKVREILSRA